MQVCAGDEIVVEVENRMTSQSTAIHWHGIDQKRFPYMDGVPYVTQWPIGPYTVFKYRFIADDPGTYFWHSHLGNWNLNNKHHRTQLLI